MEGFIFLIMVVISIIGWISNAMNENKKKGQQRAGQPQKKRRLQDELESFLSELQGEKPKQQQRKPQKQTQPRRKPQSQRRPLAESGKDSFSSQERRSSIQQKKRTSRTQSSPSRKEVVHEHSRSVFEDDSSRRVGSGDLGQELKEHVENYSSHHPGVLKDELKEKSLSELAAPKRGHKTVSNAGLSSGRQAIELLHSSQSVRAAIILNEILQPPLSQRPRRF